MRLMKRLFAPCFTLDPENKVNLVHGSIFIAIYTGVLHFLAVFYCIEILQDGRTDAFYSPIFEFNKSFTSTIATGFLVYSIFFIIFSILLIIGIKREIRFLYLFWLYSTALELIMIFLFSSFLVYRYYYFSWALFAATILIIYGSYHLYLFLAVMSQYHSLKELQEPTFIILYP